MHATFSFRADVVRPPSLLLLLPLVDLRSPLPLDDLQSPHSTPLRDTSLMAATTSPVLSPSCTARGHGGGRRLRMPHLCCTLNRSRRRPSPPPPPPPCAPTPGTTTTSSTPPPRTMDLVPAVSFLRQRATWLPFPPFPRRRFVDRCRAELPYGVCVLRFNLHASPLHNPLSRSGLA